MTRNLPIVALAMLAASWAGVAHAVSPTVLNWNRDKNGTPGPVVPFEDYTNSKTIGASGITSLTCPAGTYLASTGAKGGADYDAKKNSTTFPAGDATDGTSGTPRPAVRTWTPDISYIGFSAVSGTKVYLSCWSYK